MSPLVRAKSWGWRHTGRRGWAIRGLDLSIDAGEKVLLLGPSGAGKSTLLSALAGLLHAPEAGDEEGELLVAGQPASVMTGHCGIVFQDPSSSLVMGRIGDEVAFGLENRAVPSEQIWPIVRASLEAVELCYPLSHEVSALSGGEQQRLAIAGVLAASPALLLLDEPTANLDPTGARLVRETLSQVASERGATLVLVEHRVSELVELIDRVVVLEAGGGVAAEGDPTFVFSRYGDALRRAGVWVPGPSPARLRPPQPAGEPVISTCDVVVEYKGAPARSLDEVSVVANGGQVLAVTGANGSGKTTLALVLASLLRPSSGTVRCFGLENDEAYWRWPARKLVAFVGTVFQDPEHQFVASTVRDELAIGPRRAGMEGQEVDARVSELLERLGLAHLAPANPFTLSGGEQRRLSVATALASSPRLLVLDEPTFGQDARTWDELTRLLGESRDEGRAVVAITHDKQLVEVLADRTITLRAGRLQSAEEHV